MAAVAGGVLLAAALLGSASLAQSGDDPDTLLDRARHASLDESFAGVVTVRWRDDHGLHAQTVTARSVRGTFVVGPGVERVTGQGGVRWAGEPDAGAAGWQARATRRAPAPDASWDLALAGTRKVAGRPATVIAATDGEGRVRARFAVDRSTGQLLQREVLDRRGRVVRSVGFSVIVPTEIAPLVPVLPPSNVPVPQPIRAVPDDYVAPMTIGDSYQLLDRSRHPDGVVQLYYGDGLFALSIFEQTGHVDWSALPSGDDAHIDGVRTRSYSTPEGTVVVWGDNGLVLTGIADGPPEAATAAVSTISGHARGGGVLRDIADFVLDPFDWN